MKQLSGNSISMNDISMRTDSREKLRDIMDIATTNSLQLVLRDDALMTFVCVRFSDVL